jgi:tyrosyl-tRNA synthetase
MVEKALEEISRGTAEIIDMERIEKLVSKYYDDGSTYTVKAGFDPTESISKPWRKGTTSHW